MVQKLKLAWGRIENIVGKGKNASYQHFLLFSQCFQKATFSGLLKVEMCGKKLTFYQTTKFQTLKLKAFANKKINLSQKLKLAWERIENIVQKGENAGNQHFLLFPKCFLKTTFSGLLKLEMCDKELKALCRGSLTDIRKTAAESAEQDVTAHLLRLFLLYTAHKVNQWS